MAPPSVPPADPGPALLAHGKPPSLRQRLVSRRSAAMLVRNTVVSCASFGLGLVAMWLLVQEGGMDKYIATVLSFILANSLHYLFGRLWIFRGSARRLDTGYLYFFLNAAAGLVITVALFGLFTDIAGLNYLVARVVASLFAGLAMFVSNALLNFRSL